ncbi:MAG TPA: hypothetical protein VJS69_07380 [Candidatus Krumholzibacteria bacterium]|nr:hypothetical protein [Candidatus Krumholzibacteria bacterium]
MKKTDISRYSVWMSAAAMLLALAACSDKKTPEPPTDNNPKPLTVESVIFEPKVAVPGDTLLFTAVVTSSSQNEGDYPVYDWSANGGTFAETNKQTVRWIAPNASGVFTVTATATNAVNKSSNKASVFVGAGENLVTQFAGQVDLIGTGPDFHFLRSGDITRGVDVSAYNYASRTATDAAAPLTANGLNIAYSVDGGWGAYAADTTALAVTVRPRNIYLSDFGGHSTVRITKDGAMPGGPERNVYNYATFSPNGQLVTYQRWAQSWNPGPSAIDSFHVYIYNRVQNTHTLVTGGYQFPRGFFPTFSTDGKWLVYILDKNRSGQWDFFASPMTGNSVDVSLASVVRMTSTGGAMASGTPKELSTVAAKHPPMFWNPVSPVLAVAAADEVLYLIATNSAGAAVTPVTEVVRASEIVWSPDGSQLAASYAATVGDEVHYKVVTVSLAGDVTDRDTGLVGDVIRDLWFSPDGKYLLYRIVRGGGQWFNIADTGAGKLTSPVPVTPTDPIGLSAAYRGVMSLHPVWTSTNLMVYPSFMTGNQTPGIWTRNLAGLVN